MDYEKKYKEALSTARKLYNMRGDWTNLEIESIFPELRENEDERIRKKIIATIHLYYGEPLEDEAKEMIDWLEKQGKYNIGISEATKQKLEDNLNKALEKETPESWNEFLEKQGEQKPADYENPNIQQNDFAPKSAMEAIKEEKVDNANKVEQKFKEGDWVVYQNQTFQVTKNSGNNLILQGRRYQTYFIEELCKPWTIDDAKEGDVLYLQKDGKEHIIIYKGVLKERFMTFVSAYCAYNGIVDAFCFADVSRYVDIAYRGIMPATKEQCDQLEKAMADAGYTFDFDKRELKKIEQKPAETEKGVKGNFREIPFSEQKPAWSEEDKNRINRLIAYFEDKESFTAEDDVVYANWLKSLKDRYTWKPSKEQMEALHYVTNFDYGGHKATLVSLYEQLKKLRG